MNIKLFCIILIISIHYKKRKNMMKILYVVSTLNSGPVIVLSNIIKYLDKNRFEPIVLTPPEPKESMKIL